MEGNFAPSRGRLTKTLTICMPCSVDCQAGRVGDGIFGRLLSLYTMRPSRPLGLLPCAVSAMLAGVAVYSALAQILILPPVFDLVAALLFGVIGMSRGRFALSGAAVVAGDSFLPLRCSQLQSMALDNAADPA